MQKLGHFSRSTSRFTKECFGGGYFQLSLKNGRKSLLWKDKLYFSSLQTLTVRGMENSWGKEGLYLENGRKILQGFPYHQQPPQFYFWEGRLNQYDKHKSSPLKRLGPSPYCPEAMFKSIHTHLSASTWLPQHLVGKGRPHIYSFESGLTRHQGFPSPKNDVWICYLKMNLGCQIRKH